MRRLLVTAIISLLAASSAWAEEVDDENILMIEVAGTTEGVIEIELWPELAPEHVARVKRLAREGYYNDVVFHRVIAQFLVQTGDVKHGKRENFLRRYAGQGGSIYPDLVAEFSDTAFERGTVGMARMAVGPDTANSQFFIMLAPFEELTGQHSAFGQVLEGLDVLDRIKNGDLDQNGSVENPDYMKRVWVKADN
jgi:cyclophilin family peptidyl-prolyl cis-trans isomerase